MTLEKVAHGQLLAEFASSLLGHSGYRVWAEAADFSVRASKGEIFCFGFPYQNKQMNAGPPPPQQKQIKTRVMLRTKDQTTPPPGPATHNVPIG